MKKAKVLYICFAAAVFMMVLVGCQAKVYSYPFTQDLKNVVSVEIRKYDYATDTTTPLLTLDQSTADLLLSDIASVPCYKYFGDHTRAYGEVIVYIHYANGDAEVIGMLNTARVDSTGKWWISQYNFDDVIWCETILKYIDVELVPELNKYVQNP